VLSLQARRDVWVRTTVDGRTDAGRVLHAGDTQEITGAHDVAIRAGDAGALWVSLNGSPATRLGRDGEVLTRNFALQPPSAANPAPPKANVSPANEAAAGTATPTDGLISRDPTPPASTRGPVGGASPAAVTPDQVVDSGLQTRESRARNLEPTGSGGVSESSPDVFGIAEAADGRLVSAAERWLDAYYRGERASGEGPQPAVKDERTSDQRLPPRLTDVRRTLDDVRLQLVGDSALFTARMIERSQIGERIVTHNSLVSQMWMRKGGSWRLVDVRIVSEPRLQSGVQ
jgi:hypothetical protein